MDTRLPFGLLLHQERVSVYQCGYNTAQPNTYSDDSHDSL